jgi:hypothetical protein
VSGGLTREHGTEEKKQTCNFKKLVHRDTQSLENVKPKGWKRSSRPRSLFNPFAASFFRHAVLHPRSEIINLAGIGCIVADSHINTMMIPFGVILIVSGSLAGQISP